MASYIQSQDIGQLYPYVNGLVMLETGLLLYLQAACGSTAGTPLLAYTCTSRRYVSYSMDRATISTQHNLTVSYFQFTTTTFQSVAMYHCQPGFRERKRNSTSVILRCGNDDSWIGFDRDVETKAVCEPEANITVDW